MRKEVEVGGGAFQTKELYVQNQLSWSHMVSLCLTIWRSCPSVFQSGGIILHSQQQYMMVFLYAIAASSVVWFIDMSVDNGGLGISTKAVI